MSAYRSMHDGLVRAMAQTQSSRPHVTEARRKILRAARAQRDSLNETIAMVEQHVDARAGGDILAFRRLRTLHDERRRLDELLAKHGHLLEGDDGGHPADDDGA